MSVLAVNDTFRRLACLDLLLTSVHSRFDVYGGHGHGGACVRVAKRWASDRGRRKGGNG